MCTVKTNGLDILCDSTDQHHIHHAMSKLETSNETIFYLKLSHNHLPTLQDFLFLGLHVHQLTIHNSSLAVIEESSIYYLGRCTDDGTQQREIRCTRDTWRFHY
jgi:metal-dependent hydrolase (beta-lactamase superfamily II)